MSVENLTDEIKRRHTNINNSIAILEQKIDEMDIPTTLAELTDDSTHRVVTDEEKTTWNDKAEKQQAVFYIEGTGTTDTTNKVATWLGSHDDITEYYNGLMIAYKISTAGSTTTTLNINDLGAIPVVRNSTTAISTAYPVNSVAFLTYTTDDGTAYWKAADYDSNNYAYVRQYYTTTDNNYPLLFKYDAGLSTTTNYVTKYTRTANNMYVNPSTGIITAGGFVGDLTGNADTATKATQDASGNEITTTYANKTTDYETWTFTLTDGTVVTKKVVVIA